MDNEKDKPDTVDNMNDALPQESAPRILSENDSIEVNNLLTLADSDITPDLLMQLEMRAKEEQQKMDMMEIEEAKNTEQQEDIQIPEGLPAENGAVNITGEIMERPKTPEPVPSPQMPQTMDPLEEAKMNAVYKKYVIYINKENENFIDSLSLEERKNIINNVLHEQNILSKAELAERRRNEAIVKLLIAVITFIITVPVVYLIFNVSMEATIQNYRHSKSNFEVLYKEKGKIKINK